MATRTMGILGMPSEGLDTANSPSSPTIPVGYAGAPIRQVHVPQGRSRLATPGRRPDAAEPGHVAGSHPRVPRAARAERAQGLVLGAVLVPRDDQAVGVLERVPAGGAP